MKRKQTIKPSTGGDQFALLDTFLEAEQLLAALSASTAGLAIYDKRFRFRAVNGALANMHGVPAKAHLGKTVRTVLGEEAASFEQAIESVFATGQTVSNFEISAKLHARSEVGHWIGNYFPIRDGGGRLKRVGAIVVEITGRKEREKAFRSAISKSLQRLILAMHELEVLMGRILQGDSWSYAPSPEQTLWVSKQAICPGKPAIREKSAGGASENAPLSPPSAATGYPQARIISPREREVIRLLATGKTNKAISSILGISVKTVETHRSKIMLKLSLDSLAGLVRYAILHRIVDL